MTKPSQPVDEYFQKREFQLTFVTNGSSSPSRNSAGMGPRCGCQSSMGAAVAKSSKSSAKHQGTKLKRTLVICVPVQTTSAKITNRSGSRSPKSS